MIKKLLLSFLVILLIAGASLFFILLFTQSSSLATNPKVNLQDNEQTTKPNPNILEQGPAFQKEYSNTFFGFEYTSELVLTENSPNSVTLTIQKQDDDFKENLTISFSPQTGTAQKLTESVCEDYVKTLINSEDVKSLYSNTQEIDTTMLTKKNENEACLVQIGGNIKNFRSIQKQYVFLHNGGLYFLTITAKDGSGSISFFEKVIETFEFANT